MEKKTVYLSQTTKSPYVPRYLHGEASDPQCASFSNLVTMLKHDFMRGAVYDYDVVLDGGTYYLSAPIRFGSDFRGKVTVKAKAGEKVILSGGRQITDFTETVVNGISCLSADIPAVRLGEWYFEELYVNKEPRFRPVLPKDGKKYRITDVPGHPADDFGNTDVTFFRAEDGAFDGISHVEDTTVEILHYWLSERMTVRGYDKETKTVYTDRLPRRPLIDDTCPKYAQYRVINVFEALNRPGEWYLDREKGKLYYIPLPGETKDNILVEAPVLRNLLEITGTPEEKIGGIHFENVIFECTKSDQCDEGHAVKYATYGQAASNRDGALTLKYARDVGFSGCTVRNVGNYGVELVYGCQGFFFEKGEICHTGAGGIKALGVGVAGNERDVNTGIRVEDCSIHDCTLVDYGAIGIFIAHGNGIRLAHNDIYNLKYSGISVGWVWGMTPARTGNAVIEYNHIHHCGDGDMSDMGGIYLLGPQVGTEVRGNYIHDIHRANYGGWGIYLDEGSTGILVERNVVYDCDTSSFMIHYGTENIVRYNIFGEGKDACVCIGAAVNYDTIYATMMKNIFYYTGKSAVYNGAFNVTLDFPILATDCNFFYRPDNTPLYNLVDPKEVPAFHQSFDTWRLMGNDVFSKEYPAGERLTAVPAELKAFGVPDVDAAYAGRRKG